MSTILKLRSIWSNKNANTDVNIYNNLSSVEDFAIKIDYDTTVSKSSYIKSLSPLRKSTDDFINIIFKDKLNLKPFFSNIGFAGFSRYHTF